MYRPAAGAKAMPFELKPQTAYRPLAPATGPSSIWPSGVKLSGPFSSIFTGAVEGGETPHRRRHVRLELLHRSLNRHDAKSRGRSAVATGIA